MEKPKLKIEVECYSDSFSKEWHGLNFYELGEFFTAHQIIPELNSTIMVCDTSAYPLNAAMSNDDVDHNMEYAKVVRVMFIPWSNTVDILIRNLDHDKEDY